MPPRTRLTQQLLCYRLNADLNSPSVFRSRYAGPAFTAKLLPDRVVPRFRFDSGYTRRLLLFLEMCQERDMRTSQTEYAAKAERNRFPLLLRTDPAKPTCSSINFLFTLFYFYRRCGCAVLRGRMQNKNHSFSPGRDSRNHAGVRLRRAERERRTRGSRNAS